jgi:hypothetical protein
MANNWMDLCNMSLALIGGKSINNLDEPSEEARNCKIFLAQCRRGLLAAHPWNCATQWISPPLLGVAGRNGKPRWPYKYAFAMPEDYLRIIRIENGLPSGSLAGAARAALPYQMARQGEQLILLCNLLAPNIIYVADLENPRLLEPKLFNALAFLLAARLALPISEDLSRARLFEKKYQEALDEARLADARAGHDLIPLDDTYLRERGQPAYGLWQSASDPIGGVK